MKQTAPKAAGVILEATHKLRGNQVPGYMKANFEKAWNKFDINNDGFIKAEETHTFMRSLMGKLNKFALAPGSLSDISGGGDSMQAPAPRQQPVVRRPAPAPKKQPEPQNLAEEGGKEDADLEADINKLLEAEKAEKAMNGGSGDGVDEALVDLDI